MLGDFITRGLVLVLGYAYPAFECYKTVEKNRVEIEELRFWCQYWIIAAVLTIFERIGDIFISWIPMYGEMKLALIIYLWYPKTKGSGYIFENFLRPYVAKHETDIERNLKELRARVWDLAIYYWQNCSELGQTKFFEIIQYLASQSAKFTHPSSEKGENHYSGGSPPAPPTTPSSSKKNKHRRPPPIPPPAPFTINRAVSESPKSETVQVQLHNQTQFIHTEDTSISEPIHRPGPTDNSETGLNHSLYTARLKLRRSKGIK